MTVDAQATMIATFVDEFVRSGVTDAVVSPGQRSTLMAAALERDARIRTHVIVDERSAGFFALGLGLATGRPALVWCSSGTAAAELHPAVIEAHYARVPLLVCTADRPPELRHSRDWQSMDQMHLYGRSARWFFDVGVADEAMASSWRSIASRAVLETTDNALGAGPVHINVPIREPFDVTAAEPVSGRSQDSKWHRAHTGVVTPDAHAIDGLLDGRRGVVIAGREQLDADLVHKCAEALGWPVITQGRSGLRSSKATTVSSIDSLLRSNEFASKFRPQVVLRLGDPLLSRAMETWTEDPAIEQWSVARVATWQGRDVEVEHLVSADPNEFCRAVLAASPQSCESSWQQGWREADDAAQSAIENVLLRHAEPTEPGVARELVAMLPSGANLFCSTSMPVRDVEWYSAPRDGVRIFANRGVSGLDGITSTAAGVASATPSSANVLLIGDLGFLYDLNALWTTRGAASDVQLAVVVIDNNGGGIFSLTQHSFASKLDTETFEKVVSTPHDVDIPAVVEAFGIKVATVDSMAGFAPAVNEAIESGGLRVVYVKTDRVANVDVHRELTNAVTAAVEGILNRE